MILTKLIVLHSISANTRTTLAAVKVKPYLLWNCAFLKVGIVTQVVVDVGDFPSYRKHALKIE